ncbi:MAG: superoxide dismutase [Rickettsia sp.]|nr:superoxide dismutase [Rickettsia sp.]
MTKIFCKEANQDIFPFSLPKLNFEKEKFGNYYSLETFNYHYDIHHLTYVNNLNKLLNNNKDFQGMSLEKIILSSFKNNSPIFNNSAQVWNHSFFWNSIDPSGGGKPNAELEKLINRSFGNFDNFAEEFISNAVAQFGSGWVWLVLKNNELKIVKTSNAENPLSENLLPVLTCDVWEHAYYIDYRNKRNEFVKLFLEKMVNWDFVSQQIKFFQE